MSTRANVWDAIAEEKHWRKSIEDSVPAMHMLNPKNGQPPSGLYILCLAGRDAAWHFTRPEYLISRDVFVAELKRLMVEPTMPSRPVPDVHAYQEAQKRWLEVLVKKYEGS